MSGRQQLTRLLVLTALLAPACDGCSDRTLPLQLPDDTAERYAAGLCAAESACGCQQYLSIDACESDVIAAFDRATVEISSFDEDCFEELLTNLDSQGCVDSSDFPGSSCLAIVGTSRVGEACQRDPRVKAAMPRGSCESGAFCDLDSGKCTNDGSNSPLPGAGDPCTPHHLGSCGLDLYCDADARCAPRTAEGEACSYRYECKSSFCATDTGICTQYLDLDQPCNANDWRPCTPVMTSETTGEFTWCNPNTAVCELHDPYVCSMLDYPFPP
jgi:hypothetical protein